MRRPIAAVYFFVLALLLTASSLARAAADYAALYGWPKFGVSGQYFAFSDQLNTATWYCTHAYNANSHGIVLSVNSATPPVLSYQCADTNNTVFAQSTIPGAKWCPSGGTYNSGTGMCTGVPDPPPPPPAVPAVYCYGYVGTAGQCNETALAQCQLQFFGAYRTAAVATKLPDGSYSCMSTVNGVTVTGNPLSPPTITCPSGYHQDLNGNLNNCLRDDVAAPSPSQGVGIPNQVPTPTPTPACPAGQVLGQVNGVNTCLAAGTPSTEAPVTKTTTQTPVTTTTNPDGSTTATSSKSVSNTNADGTVTTTVTTTTVNTAVNGAVTTSVTSQSTVSGTPGGTATQSAGTGDSADTPTGKAKYEASKLTVASVMGEFKNTVMSSPAITAATQFLTLENMTGSCPSWVLNIGFMNFSHDLSQYFCGSMMSTVLQTMSTGLMIIASLIAFSIAFL